MFVLIIEFCQLRWDDGGIEGTREERETENGSQLRTGTSLLIQQGVNSLEKCLQTLLLGMGVHKEKSKLFYPMFFFSDKRKAGGAMT